MTVVHDLVSIRGAVDQREDQSKAFCFQHILNDEFFIQYWTREVVHFPASPDRLQDIFGWSQLNSVLQLTHKVLQPPSLRVVRDGVAVSIDAYTDVVADRKTNPFRQVSSRKIVELCSDGATLVIDGIERFWTPLRLLTDELFKLTGERVQANAYYSQKPLPGFKLHYDTHEVFVLQVAGSKLWRIGGTSYPYPLYTQPSAAHEPFTGEYKEFILRRGSILYLPRGVWHSAVATDEPSLHLSVGVHCRTRLEFLIWVIKSLADRAELRENLHCPGMEMNRDVLMAGLQSAVAEKLSEATIIDQYKAASESLRESAAVNFEFPT